MSDLQATPNISIIVPAFNEERGIVPCLTSLANQNVDLSYEVILVDNNCTDRTVEVARSVPNLNLRIIHEPRQGRGAARAAGFAVASGAILCSADADTLYPPTWLRKFLTALLPTDAVGVSGSCRVDDLGPLRSGLFNLTQPCVMHLYRVMFGHYWLSGFSFAIRRDAYFAAGGFDPTLNAEEDLDLSFKVARIGRILFLNVPVTFSGRRFKSGLLSGALEYVHLFRNYRSGRAEVRLSDVR